MFNGNNGYQPAPTTSFPLLIPMPAPHRAIPIQLKSSLSVSDNPMTLTPTLFCMQFVRQLCQKQWQCGCECECECGCECRWWTTDIGSGNGNGSCLTGWMTCRWQAASVVVVVAQQIATKLNCTQNDMVNSSSSNSWKPAKRRVQEHRNLCSK